MKVTSGTPRHVGILRGLMGDLVRSMQGVFFEKYPDQETYCAE